MFPCQSDAVESVLDRNKQVCKWRLLWPTSQLGTRPEMYHTSL